MEIRERGVMGGGGGGWRGGQGDGLLTEQQQLVESERAAPLTSLPAPAPHLPPKRVDDPAD